MLRRKRSLSKLHRVVVAEEDLVVTVHRSPSASARQTLVAEFESELGRRRGVQKRALEVLQAVPGAVGDAETGGGERRLVVIGFGDRLQEKPGRFRERFVRSHLSDNGERTGPLRSLGARR